MDAGPVLRRFTVEGYRGFDGPVTLDLTAVGDYGFNRRCIRDGIIRKCMVLGRNGCGKSDLGLALHDIAVTLTDPGTDGGRCDPRTFLNVHSGSGRARFVYELQDGDRVIVYSYSKTSPDRIVHETLTVDGSTVFEVGDGADDLSGLAVHGAEVPDPEAASGRMPLLRYVIDGTVQGNGSPLSSVMRFARGIMYLGPDGGMDDALRYVVDHDLVAGLQGFLSDMTGSEVGLAIADVPGNGREVVRRMGDGYLPFHTVASGGTVQLVRLFHLMERIGDATFLYIDGFGPHYHHTLTERVVMWIRSMDHVQVVFTSHDTSLVCNRILRPDCYLVMDGRGLNPLPYLTDREIREGHNLGRLLRGGEFDDDRLGSCNLAPGCTGPSDASASPSDPIVIGLRRIVGPIAERHGMMGVYLFGSHARGDHRPDSDYDFCVVTGPECGMFELAGFFSDLRDAVGSDIDLVCWDELDGGFADAVRGDLVSLFGAEHPDLV